MDARTSSLAAALIRQGWETAHSITAHLDGLSDATPNPDQEAAPYDKYIPINQQRIKRIRKSLAKQGLSPALLAAVRRVKAGTKMLVLNEFWCGDGAQILPVHEAMELISDCLLYTSDAADDP